MGDKLNTGISELLERKAEKVAAAKARKEQREEEGVVNALVIEREPTGLYFARYSLSGPMPEELRGRFTSKQRILDIAARRSIPVV